MSQEYIYNDLFYNFVAVHRKVTEYDPRNTDNPIILEYLDIIKNIDNSDTYYYMLNELRLSHNQLSLPISFTSVLYKLNILWVDLIHQMIFKDRSTGLFMGEYVDIIESIIANNSITEKYSLIYRFHNGDCMLQMSAQLWLLRKYREYLKNNKPKALYAELQYITMCYEDMEWFLGENRKGDIINITDYNGVSLINNLRAFTYNLVTNGNI
jgi:hypothetical protein